MLLLMCHKSRETEAQHESFLVVEVDNRISLEEPEQPVHFVRVESSPVGPG